MRTEVLFNLTRGGIFALILFIIALKKYFVPFLFISLVCGWCFVCFFFFTTYFIHIFSEHANLLRRNIFYNIFCAGGHVQHGVKDPF